MKIHDVAGKVNNFCIFKVCLSAGPIFPALSAIAEPFSFSSQNNLYLKNWITRIDIQPFFAYIFIQPFPQSNRSKKRIAAINSDQLKRRKKYE